MSALRTIPLPALELRLTDAGERGVVVSIAVVGGDASESIGTWSTSARDLLTPIRPRVPAVVMAALDVYFAEPRR